MAKYRANAQEPFKTLKVKALDSMPIASGIDYYGLNTDIPTGWLLCDGSAVSRTEYSELFAKIGTYYGSGDGSTTFNLPDMRERTGVGINPDDTTEQFDLIGKTGGSKTDNLSNAYAKVGRSSADYNVLQYKSKGGVSDTFDRKLTISGSTIGGSSNTITDATELGGSVSTLQPYTIVCKLIKAKNTTPTMASIVNGYSTSTQDGYSCDYVNNAFGGKVLWTNNSTSSFDEQQITLNSSDYNYLEIYYLVYTGSTVVKCDKMQKGTNANLSSMFIYGGNNFGGVRNVNYVDDTHLSIKDCGKVIQNNVFATGNDNSWLIPIKIIGYK